MKARLSGLFKTTNQSITKKGLGETKLSPPALRFRRVGGYDLFGRSYLFDVGLKL